MVDKKLFPLEIPFVERMKQKIKIITRAIKIETSLSYNYKTLDLIWT